MARLVSTHYRYKRPPRKKKAVALEVPPIVTKRAAKPARATSGQRRPQVGDRHREAPTAAEQFPDVPNMTPEEHKRRGELPMRCSAR